MFVNRRKIHHAVPFCQYPNSPRGATANLSFVNLEHELPSYLQKDIDETTKKTLAIWAAQGNAEKYRHLVGDFAGVRPKPYREEEQPPPTDIYSSGALHQCGVIRTVAVSPQDGRVNAGRLASPSERIQGNVWDFLLRTFLHAFKGPVKEWLISADGDSGVYQAIGGELAHDLAWESETTDLFMEGMTAWIGGYPQVAFAFWAPSFEACLRNQLAAFGEDVLNPQPRTGIENFVVLDTLLKKAANHYDERTVEYWRRVFSTSNAIGWNLRNSFCHGLLNLETMKQEELCLALFLGYLFLLQKGAPDRTN